MHVVAMALLLGDDVLKRQMETLAEWDMAVSTVEPGRMALLDRDGATVLSCAMRLDPLSQLSELLTLYLDEVLCPDETRH